MEDGSGVGDLYPSLNDLGPSYAYNNIACIIRNGKKSEGKVIEMIGLKDLSEIEITNIINYLQNDLNQVHQQISLQETEELLLNCSE